MVAERYWIETLGCPKNQVDSDKLVGTLITDGFEPADSPQAAELVVVNTCAFIEAARQESVDTVLALSDARQPGARLVVTGCMAERYGDELADALPEVDLVAPFGASLTDQRREAMAVSDPPTGAVAVSVPPTAVTLGKKPPAHRTADVPSFDLLNLPRPPASAPWSYIKIAEGCDRNCGFCAIPSFRGKQRSRTVESILAEVDQLGGPDGILQEAILVAQDLSSFALDRSHGRTEPALDGPVGAGRRPIADLVARVADRVRWTRLLYLYPSTLDDSLVETILATGVPYFDLSLQHVSRPLLKRMRRWGDGQRFLDRVGSIRASEPAAAFRSSFIIGYPGETEDDHDRLLEWLTEAQLDWVGFFPFSREAGTHASGLDGQVPEELVVERLSECGQLQDAITASRRESLIGTTIEVLVEASGVGRTYREAPEIDGVVTLPDHLPVGTFADVVVTGADGPDLIAEPVAPDQPLRRLSPAGGEAPRRGQVSVVAGAVRSAMVPSSRGHRSRPHRSADRALGPSALLTPANGITVLRLAATPVVIVLILLWGASWFTFVFGGLLALSDGIDGWLARKMGTTRSGAFLDPLADKVVVLGALFALVAKGIVWWVPVALIAIREIAMSVYRSVVGRHGVSIPARNSAKVKTLLQDLAIGLCLAPPLAGHDALLSVAIWVAAAMTVFTGAQYYVDGRRARSKGLRGPRSTRCGRRHQLGGMRGRCG